MEKLESAAEHAATPFGRSKRFGRCRQWRILLVIAIGWGQWAASIRQPADVSKPHVVRGRVSWKSVPKKTVEIGREDG